MAAAEFGHGVLTAAVAPLEVHFVGDVFPAFFDGGGANAFCCGLFFVSGDAVEGHGDAALFEQGELRPLHDDVVHAQGQVAVCGGVGLHVSPRLST